MSVCVIMNDGFFKCECRPEYKSARVRVNDLGEMHTGNESGQERV